MENFVFKNSKEVLESCLGQKISELNPKKNVVFVFCANGMSELQEVGKFLSKSTDAWIVGCTTAGNIFNSQVYDDGIVISILEAEKGEIFVSYAEENDDFLNGKKIATELSKHVNEKEKPLLILLTDGIYTTGERTLEGIFQVFKNFSVIGGKAGCCEAHLQTAILVRDKLIVHGAVGILLKEVEYKANYLFDWEEIGHEHLITKSVGNRVYSINHLPAVEFYRKYLGDEVAQSLPISGVEYPLILRKGNFKIARACIVKHEDGSLSFAGEVPEGARVKLGCGSLRDKEKHLSKFFDLVEDSCCFLVFSCIARKRFLGDLLEEELRSLDTPNCGFFTFGEYFSECLLNETLTVVGLEKRREKKRKEKKRDILHSLTNASCHGNF
jgi:hypothetical protein